jgi:sucrose-6-phosphate hydrolase SacC (GH32 family)
MMDPKTGRRDISPVIVGNFDGFNFRPLFEQEMDFGTHAYAFQVIIRTRGWIGEGERK